MLYTRASESVDKNLRFRCNLIANKGFRIRHWQSVKQQIIIRHSIVWMMLLNVKWIALSIACYYHWLTTQCYYIMFGNIVKRHILLKFSTTNKQKLLLVLLFEMYACTHINNWFIVHTLALLLLLQRTCLFSNKLITYVSDPCSSYNLNTLKTSYRVYFVCQLFIIFVVCA